MPATPKPDVETGLGRPAAVTDDDEAYEGADENQALLANTNRDHGTDHTSTGNKREASSSSDNDTPSSPTGPTKSDGYQVGMKKMSGSSYYAQLIGAFVVGVACTVIMHLIVAHCSKPTSSSWDDNDVGNVNVQAVPPYVGSSEVHHFPPAEPTNKFPELFPSNVGYAGATPTGAEPAIVATAPSWPMHTGAPHLVVPTKFLKHHKHKHEEDDEDDDDDEDDEDEYKHGKGKGRKGKKRKFNMLEKWGNLSPWYSIERGGFGLDSGPETPETCRITGLHFLHRHGARYPTEWGESLLSRLWQSKIRVLTLMMFF